MTEAEILAAHGVTPRGTSSQPMTEAEILASHGVGAAASEVPFKVPFLKEGAVDSSRLAELKSNPLSFLAKALGESFSHSDPEARAMSQSQDYLGGMVRTGVRKVGGQDVTDEDWARTKRGEAPSFVETGARGNPDAGVGNFLKGSFLDTITNPMASTMARGEIIAPEVSSAWRALAQGASKGDVAKGALKDVALVANQSNPLSPFTNPIAGALQGTGKWLYRQPWRPADSKILKYTDSKKFGPHEFSDQLWNSGVGGYGKSNADIKNEIDSVSQKNYKRMAEMTDGIEPIDLAPTITQAADTAGQKAILDAVHGNLEDNQNYHILARQAEAQPYDTSALIPTKRDIKVGKPPPELDPQDLKIAAEGASDAAKNAIRSDILKRFNAGPSSRARAVEDLKKLAPKFADPIDEALENFSTGKAKEGGDAFNKILDDVMHGPRTIDELSKLGTSYGNVAAGSEAMRSNAYQNSSKVSDKQKTAMGMKKNIADQIEDLVGSKVDELLPGHSLGDAAKAAFAGRKHDYGAFARGKQPALNVVQRAEAAPAFSKLDAALLAAATGGSLYQGEFDPKLLAAAMGGKGMQLLTRSPRFASTVGKGVYNQGQVGLWDAMARQMLLNSGKSQTDPGNTLLDQIKNKFGGQ